MIGRHFTSLGAGEATHQTMTKGEAIRPRPIFFAFRRRLQLRPTACGAIGIDSPYWAFCTCTPSSR